MGEGTASREFGREAVCRAVEAACDCCLAYHASKCRIDERFDRWAALIDAFGVGISKGTDIREYSKSALIHALREAV